VTAENQRAGQPTLHGRSVLLRPVARADVPTLQAILEEPAVRRWWGANVPAADMLADEEVVAFVVEVDGRVAGAIQYEEEDDPEYRHAGIDVFLGTAFQGRGIGTDAVRTLARYLIDARGHHRLTIDPAADNDRAIRTYEKVGFRRVGIMRRYEQGPDGTFHDGLLMDLLAGELMRE
jgi:aminoglycoside 6'-N-acetyltransferase